MPALFDEDVDPAVALEDTRGGARHRLLVGDVERRGLGGAAGGGDRGRHLVELARPASAQHHDRPRLRELARAGAADAAARAGDPGHFALQHARSPCPSRGIMAGRRRAGNRARRAAPSILLVGQELAAHADAHAVALLIGLALDRHVEIDGAHDAVAELLLDQRFPGGAVDLHHLESADPGRSRRRRHQAPSISTWRSSASPIGRATACASA